MKKEDLLSGVPLLASVSDKYKAKIFPALRMKQYAKGATVHNQGEECRTLDVVLSGGLVAYSLAENGSATVLFEFQRNSVIGANLLFADDRRYPLSIYCLSDCTLAHIERETVEELLHDHGFVIQYVLSLSRNSQGLNRKMLLFSRRNLRKNILDYLKQQALLQGSNRVRLPVSKREWADSLGVQRPSLFRELKKMREEGLIAIENRIITLKPE